LHGKYTTVAASALYSISAAFCCAPLAGHVHLVDLHVYRMGGDAVLHGLPLYSMRYAGQLPFTYPPFAALLFTCLAWLPWLTAAVLITALSVAALPVMLYLALQLPPSPLRGQRSAWDLALAAGVAVIWLEPVHSTLFYGQVDVFIACAVLYDLTLPDASPVKGMAIGLAAAFKLTPALFVVYLFLTRRYRAAATAAAVFAGSVALGFAVLPAASAYFWDISFLRPGRVSPPQNTQNQSLLGALARSLHSASVTVPWLILATPVAVTGLVLAVRAWRRGDHARGYTLCAVTELLISPISWTHHWVLAAPALLLAIVAIWRNWAQRPVAASAAGAAAVTAIAVVAWAQVARRVPNGGWLRLPPSAIVRSELYVIIGLGVLVAAAASEIIGYTRTKPGRPAASRFHVNRPWVAVSPRSRPPALLRNQATVGQDVITEDRSATLSRRER
jgi:alpha-1,2-mannosyltransferase